MGISHGLVSFWDRGRRVPEVEDVAGYLAVLGVVGEEKLRILELARNANSSDQNWLPSGWPGLSPALAGVLDCEATAVGITQWALTVIPGLLQPPRYTRVMLGDSPDVDSIIETRTARRSIITRAEHPVEYVAFISEFALDEPIGAPDQPDATREVHAEQLGYLLELGKLSNVTVRVVRLGQGWHPGFTGPFIVYDFDDSPSIIHIEHFRSSAFLYEEGDVKAYKETALQTLRGKAMSPEASAELIASKRRKMEMR